MTESPSALLERAAAKLEDLAVEATGGPWEVEHRTGDIVSPTLSPSRVTRVVTAGGPVEILPENQTWIATLSPSVAPPLVEWLREAVVQYNDEHAAGTVPAEDLDVAWSRHPAVRLARLIVGEEEE